MACTRRSRSTRSRTRCGSRISTQSIFTPPTPGCADADLNTPCNSWYEEPGSSFTIIDGDVVAGTLANRFGRVDRVVADYTEDKSLAASGLNLAWGGDTWSGAADLSYSEAKRTNQWLAIDLVAFPEHGLVRLSRRRDADVHAQLRSARCIARANLEHHRTERGSRST